MKKMKILKKSIILNNLENNILKNGMTSMIKIVITQIILHIVKLSILFRNSNSKFKQPNYPPFNINNLLNKYDLIMNSI